MMRLALAGIALLLGAGCADRNESAHQHESGENAHAHEDAHEQEKAPRGVHGGKMYADGDVRLELGIDEAEGRPTFVAHIVDESGKTLSTSADALTIELVRFGERREAISFRKEGEMLRSASVIAEPHSFQSAVTGNVRDIGLLSMQCTRRPFRARTMGNGLTPAPTSSTQAPRGSGSSRSSTHG